MDSLLTDSLLVASLPYIKQASISGVTLAIKCLVPIGGWIMASIMINRGVGR